MRISRYQITTALQPFLKEICVFQSDCVEPATFRRVLPDACVELFVNLGNDSDSFIVDGQIIKSRFFVVSRMNRFTDVSSLGRPYFMSFWFRSGRSWPFFRVPMSTLANMVVPLNDLWGSRVAEMERILSKASTELLQVETVTRLLIAQLADNFRPDLAFQFSLDLIESHLGQLGLDEVAIKSGIGRRQLLRKYDQYMGMGPKDYSRVTRFLHASKLLKSPLKNFTEIAYEAGYFDQAHFIHDNRLFSGVTPGELRQTPNILF
jgi:AraC-like DNA-binding protein